MQSAKFGRAALPQDVLEVGTILRSKASGTTVKVIEQLQDGYQVLVLQPGEFVVPAHDRYKIGASWWNFYERVDL
jgi:hypothetical protein